MATTVGSGSYQYELNESWARLPTGWAWGQVSAVATDSQDRVYAFQRKDPPVVVFDRDGNYLTSWGHSAIKDPHGIAIVDDLVVYAAALLSPLAPIAQCEPAAA
jgi:DNA-binding beta-propeller fold protein YncE